MNIKTKRGRGWSQSAVRWLKCSRCRIHDCIFPVHDSNRFSDCAVSISPCILMTQGHCHVSITAVMLAKRGHLNWERSFVTLLSTSRPQWEGKDLRRRDAAVIRSSVINTNFSLAPAELVCLSSYNRIRICLLDRAYYTLDGRTNYSDHL